MNDNEIIKALECCSSPNRDLKCDNCPAHSDYCCMLKPSEVFDLIKRQQAEVESLRNGYLNVSKIRSEARREFAERLTDEASVKQTGAFEYSYQITQDQINYLLYKMEKENNDEC